MAHSIEAWLLPFSTYSRTNASAAPNPAFLRDLENRMHLGRALDRGGPRAAHSDLLRRMQANGEFALSVVDYVLFHLAELVSANRQHYVDDLATVMRDGGSVWEPTVTERANRWALTRRALAGSQDALADVGTLSDRVGGHLTSAWGRLAGRNPDASAAYAEAIKAVEAAAKPVVCPDDALATLGKMRAAIRDKPEKWQYELGDVSQIAMMMGDLAKSQPDRHGHDGELETATRERADAAFYLALALSRFFVTGAVRRV